jgi:hypothetical protein
MESRREGTRRVTPRGKPPFGLVFAAALTLCSSSALAKPCSWSLRLDGAGRPTLRALLVEHNVLSLESPACEHALATVDVSERGGG